MIEKGRTPSGMSEAGYHQALENFVYQINQITKAIEAHPVGSTPMDKVASLVSRGEIFEEFQQPIETLDKAFVVIAETYGYSEQQVEKDLQDRFAAHIGDFMLEALFGG